MASIAVFVALGGVSYAATTFNGNKIIKQTVGGGKLKNGTITSTQVKKNSLTGDSIDESSLGTVPAAETAQTATSATTAATATTAGSANTAGSADTAQSATTAEHALSADTATQATEAVSAEHAATAGTAGSATTADSATTAGDADTLDGLTSQQLQVACPAETELFGGMCWDEDARLPKDWIAASVDCGNHGGRLPSLSELIAYVLQGGTQVSGENWTADVADLGPGNEEVVLTRDETTTGTHGSLGTSIGYHCLFYRVN
jgi:hypothetical protein